MGGDERWWDRLRWISAYRSEEGGWCVRIGAVYFHVTGLFKWRRFA